MKFEPNSAGRKSTSYVFFNSLEGTDFCCASYSSFNQMDFKLAFLLALMFWFQSWHNVFWVCALTRVTNHPCRKLGDLNIERFHIWYHRWMTGKEKIASLTAATDYTTDLLNCTLWFSLLTVFQRSWQVTIIMMGRWLSRNEVDDAEIHRGIQDRTQRSPRLKLLSWRLEEQVGGRHRKVA